MTLLRDEGVILRTYRLGEADRIIVALTEQHGKVRAVAKGVRKTASKFGSRLEPLTHVSLILWRGRSDLDIVNQVEVIERYWNVRGDFDRLQAGLAMVEVVDQVTQENQADVRTVATLTRALRVLDDPSRDPTMIVPSFFLRMLEIDGAGPIVDACASCGSETNEIVAFDLNEGGVLCRSCRRGRPLSSDGLAVLRRITGGDLAGVLTGPPPAGSLEIAALATEAMECHLDRRLRAARSVSGH